MTRNGTVPFLKETRVSTRKKSPKIDMQNSPETTGETPSKTDPDIPLGEREIKIKEVCFKKKKRFPEDSPKKKTQHENLESNIEILLRAYVKNITV